MDANLNAKNNFPDAGLATPVDLSNPARDLAFERLVRAARSSAYLTGETDSRQALNGDPTYDRAPWAVRMVKEHPGLAGAIGVAGALILARKPIGRWLGAYMQGKIMGNAISNSLGGGRGGDLEDDNMTDGASSNRNVTTMAAATKSGRPIRIPVGFAMAAFDIGKLASEYESDAPLYVAPSILDGDVMNVLTKRCPNEYFNKKGIRLSTSEPYIAPVLAGGFLKKLKKVAKKAGSVVKKVTQKVSSAVAKAAPALSKIASVIPGVGGLAEKAISIVGKVAGKTSDVLKKIDGATSKVQALADAAPNLASTLLSQNSNGVAGLLNPSSDAAVSNLPAPSELAEGDLSPQAAQALTDNLASAGLVTKVLPNDRPIADELADTPSATGSNLPSDIQDFLSSQEGLEDVVLTSEDGKTSSTLIPMVGDGGAMMCGSLPSVVAKMVRYSWRFLKPLYKRTVAKNVGKGLLGWLLLQQGYDTVMWAKGRGAMMSLADPALKKAMDGYQEAYSQTLKAPDGSDSAGAISAIARTWNVMVRMSTLWLSDLQLDKRSSSLPAVLASFLPGGDALVRADFLRKVKAALDVSLLDKDASAAIPELITPALLGLYKMSSANTQGPGTQRWNDFIDDAWGSAFPGVIASLYTPGLAQLRDIKALCVLLRAVGYPIEADSIETGIGRTTQQAPLENLAGAKIYEGIGLVSLIVALAKYGFEDVFNGDSRICQAAGNFLSASDLVMTELSQASAGLYNDSHQLVNAFYSEVKTCGALSALTASLQLKESLFAGDGVTGSSLGQQAARSMLGITATSGVGTSTSDPIAPGAADSTTPSETVADADALNELDEGTQMSVWDAIKGAFSEEHLKTTLTALGISAAAIAAALLIYKVVKNAKSTGATSEGGHWDAYASAKGRGGLLVNMPDPIHYW